MPCEDSPQQSDGTQMAIFCVILRPIFPASCVQHISFYIHTKATPCVEVW